MEDERFDEHPLDSLLDSEPEDEFGVPQIHDGSHSVGGTFSGNLKSWTAQDFASIHIRFRPHLERHARRYLSNPVTAEEVVQDAFLYLMTALPEIDTEQGVFKFLKWKTRLLCLDILRSASHQRQTSITEGDDFSSNDNEISAELERAEDSAVIRLALSSLNPRQREVLVASVYEEKTTEEIAEQINLSPNATRQLLFRSRNAFKKALIGEAEVKGKSVSQILSIAAKKAALTTKNNGLKVGSLVLLLVLGVGLLPSPLPTPSSLVAEVSPPRQVGNQALVEQIRNIPDNQSKLEKTEQQSNSPEDANAASGPERPEVLETEEEAAVQSEQPSGDVTEPAGATPDRLTDTSLNTILTTNVANAGLYTESYSALFGELFRGVSVEVFGGTGISAFLDLEPSTKSVRQSIFQMRVEGRSYFAVASKTSSETVDNGDGYTVAVVSQEFYLVDEELKVNSETLFAESEAVVTMDLDENGNPLSASLKLSKLGME